MGKREQLLAAIRKWPGLDDDELSRLTGIEPRQQVNQLAHKLVATGQIRRYPGADGKLVNDPVELGEGSVMPSGASGSFANPPVPEDRPNSGQRPSQSNVDVEGPRRNFGGRMFELITEIDPKRDSNGEIFLDHPECRYGKADTAKLHRYGEGPFCKFRVSNAPRVAGVFVLVVEEGPAYVGQGRSLERRFNNQIGHIAPSDCYPRGQSTNCRLNKLILAEAQADRKVQLWIHRTTDIEALKSELRDSLELPWDTS